MGFYIPEDDILHSHCRENLKSYIALTGWTLYRRVSYELRSGFLYPRRRSSSYLDVHAIIPFMNYRLSITVGRKLTASVV
jgi:hypothetical protein